ncbi:unnamed protein product, partial [Phaeothamnion confervicola]
TWGTISLTAAGITVGVSTVSSGTTTRVLYDNAGVLGEYTISGSGNVAMTASPTFTGTVTGAASNWSGNVGIGTTAPSYKLDVSNGGGSTAIYTDGHVTAQRFTSIWDAYLTALTGRSVFIGSGGNTTALTVLSGGNVGIGTTSPSTTLQVNGTATATLFSGSGASLTGIGTSSLSATGTANSTTYLRGDNTWGTISLTAAGITVGVSSISSGTTTRVLYNNAGVLGEYTISGTGNVAMSASPTLTGTITAAAANFSGNVGIKTTSPLAAIDVRSANQVIGTNYGQAFIATTDSAAVDKGGYLVLGGSYTGTTPVDFASVAGRKENSSSGDYAGYLALGPTPAGGANT